MLLDDPDWKRKLVTETMTKSRVTSCCSRRKLACCVLYSSPQLEILLVA